MAATTISSRRYLSNSLGNCASNLEKCGENGSRETSYTEASSFASALISSTTKLICCMRKITGDIVGQTSCWLKKQEIDSHSASSSTFFLNRRSSLTNHFLRSSSALASRARPSRSHLQTSATKRRLCRTSGIRSGSVEGVQDAEDTSAKDAISRGWGSKIS
jgi:hypothetical protein